MDGSQQMKPARADQIRPLDMFKIGVGPSSSHTVGPMIAALNFRNRLAALPARDSGLRLQVELFGSLSLTGRGHSTDAAGSASATTCAHGMNQKYKETSTGGLAIG